MAGGTLWQFWSSFGNALVPVEEAVEVVRQMCQGLSVAHREKPPIVHRDIKPHNVLVGYDGTGLRIRLSDFGLAKHVNPLSMLASARGTPLYKAPEVLADMQGDSCASDIWSVGLCLYLLLTDRLPYMDPDADERAVPARPTRPWVAPGKYNVQCDSRLDEIVRRAVALNPQDRYQNAPEMLVDLEEWAPNQTAVPNTAATSKTVLGGRAWIGERNALQMASDRKSVV